MSETPRTVELRITDYLCGGGLFNPELANHDAVRDLLIDARDALTAERERADRLIAFLADDALAITYQSLAQYRQAAIDAARRK